MGEYAWLAALATYGAVFFVAILLIERLRRRK
jgi:hypothetical protein